MSYRLSVRVNPNSSRRKARWKGEFLKVNLTAPPEKGRANKELLDFLEELFQLEAGDVQLVSGTTSRRKTLRLMNLERDQLVRTLKSLERDIE
jgi:uncharacterized protein (TIGR00251 family)